jgi:hypothetical protein
MPHLTYHKGDRTVYGFPERDLDIDDQQIVDYLTAATHSDGSRIWALPDPEPQKAEQPPAQVTPPTEPPQSPQPTSQNVQVKAADGATAANKA